MASSLSCPNLQASIRFCRFPRDAGGGSPRLTLPSSMLHHTNLDRLWSYWQALRPDQATFTNSYAGQSRFTVPTGTTITPRSPLQPFYSGGGRSHTTESVQRIRDFGYSYTGLEYWQKSQAQMAQDVKRLINRLYAPNSRSLKRRQQPATGKRYFARIRFDRAHVPRPCKVQLYVCNQHVSSIVVSAQPPRGHMAAGVPLDKITQTSEVTAMSNDATAQLLQSDLSVKVVKVSRASFSALLAVADLVSSPAR